MSGFEIPPDLADDPSLRIIAKVLTTCQDGINEHATNLRRTDHQEWRNGYTVAMIQTLLGAMDASRELSSSDETSQQTASFVALRAMLQALTPDGIEVKS